MNPDRTQVRADWQAQVLQVLHALRDLRENWDGYNADAPVAAAVDEAIRCVPILATRTDLPVPYVVPTRVGVFSSTGAAGRTDWKWSGSPTAGRRSSLRIRRRTGRSRAHCFLAPP